MNGANHSIADRIFGRLSDRDRRALLLGSSVVLPVLLWIGAVRPYRRALTDVLQRAAAERALLAREEGLLAHADALPAALVAALSEGEQAERRLLTATSPTAAEAELIDRLESMASSSRVLLEGIQGVPPPRGAALPAGIQSVALGIDGQSDLNGVTNLLRRIEGGLLVMRVTELSIEPLVARAGATTDARAGAPTVDVTGYVSFHLGLEGFAPLPAATASNDTIQEPGS